MSDQHVQILSSAGEPKYYYSLCGSVGQGEGQVTGYHSLYLASFSHSRIMIRKQPNRPSVDSTQSMNEFIANYMDKRKSLKGSKLSIIPELLSRPFHNAHQQ
jgi:hypothetical protein